MKSLLFVENKKQDQRPCFDVVAEFLPLDKGKVNEVHEGLAVSGEEGICLSVVRHGLGVANNYQLFARKQDKVSA